MTEARKAEWADEEQRAAFMAVRQTDAHKEAKSAGMRAAWKDPELRRRASEAAKRRWNDPAFREKVAEIFGSDKFRQRISGLAKPANFARPAALIPIPPPTAATPTYSDRPSLKRKTWGMPQKERGH